MDEGALAVRPAALELPFIPKAGLKISAKVQLKLESSIFLQAPLPVVDNNRKVVGALSVVGEKFSKILANNYLQNF